MSLPPEVKKKQNTLCCICCYGFYWCVTFSCVLKVELTHLSACRDALWGLDCHGQVFIRPLSPSCPTGLHWTHLDLNQLGMDLSLDHVYSFTYLCVHITHRVFMHGLCWCRLNQNMDSHIYFIYHKVTPHQIHAHVVAESGAYRLTCRLRCYVCVPLRNSLHTVQIHTH